MQSEKRITKQPASDGRNDGYEGRVVHIAKIEVFAGGNVVEFIPEISVSSAARKMEQQFGQGQVTDNGCGPKQDWARYQFSLSLKVRQNDLLSTAMRKFASSSVRVILSRRRRISARNGKRDPSLVPCSG
jgi:hypothetical protein